MHAGDLAETLSIVSTLSDSGGRIAADRTRGRGVRDAARLGRRVGSGSRDAGAA